MISKERVICLFVQHGFEKYPNSISRTHRILNSIFPKKQIDFYLIDNSSKFQAGEIFEFGNIKGYIVSCENERREFGAWDFTFREFIEQEYSKNTFVVLCTSALEEMYSEYLDYFKELDYSNFVNMKFAIGHIDYFDNVKTIENREIKYWLRTAFIITNYATLEGCLPLYINRDDLELKMNLFQDSETIFSRDYKDHILNWLVFGKTMQNTKWHSKIEINDIQKLVDKTNAMLNELHLTSKLLDIDARVLDVRHVSQCSELCVHSFTSQVSQR